jgi:NitT/TauT family transport system permease protein
MKRKELLYAVLALLGIWLILAWLVDQPILPSPTDVAVTFVEEIISGELPQHFAASLWRVLVSTMLAIAVAAPIGLILGQSKRLDSLFSPVIYLLYPIPKVVLVPIVLLFFGIGNFPKIVIIFMILFFQILVLVRDRAASIQPNWHRRSCVIYS